MKTQYYLPLLLLSSSILFLNGCGGGGSTSTPIPVDNIAPSISLKGANPLTIALNDAFTDPGATATDDIDGDISNKITETNNIKTDVAGCYLQQYEIKDNAGNKSTIKRTVFVGNDLERHSPNLPPVAFEDAVTTVYTETVTFNVLQNDTDANCDTLTIDTITQATNGTATLNADNTITFDPLNTVGSFYISYVISDGHGGTSFAGISIASHDPADGNDNWPAAVIDTATTKQGTAVFIDVLANDSDDDGDSLILGSIDTPKNGSITVNSNGILYTPNPGFIGTDSFYYGVHDGHGHTDSALVTVTVTP